MKKILAIDLSSTKTGYAVYENEKLIDCGACVPKNNKHKYPLGSLLRMKSMSDDIEYLIDTHNPDIIIMEEVIKSPKSSILSQKVLDGTHFIVLDMIANKYGNLDRVYYYPPNWWRNRLDIKLSPKDKAANALNKRGKKVKKITLKDVAVRWIMKNHPYFKFTKDDHDVADAICLGAAFLKK